MAIESMRYTAVKDSDGEFRDADVDLTVSGPTDRIGGTACVEVKVRIPHDPHRSIGATVRVSLERAHGVLASFLETAP